jgi:hypothetical protein
MMNGPASYENWRQQLDGAECRGGHETPIFTDARILGMVQNGCGPYQFLNTGSTYDRPKVLRPAIVVRVEHFGEYKGPVWGETDEAGYHGGGIDDELAAVLSLCLGIRAQPGDATRQFHPTDPQGLPCAWGFRTDPMLPPSRGALVLPSTVDAHSLEALEPFLRFHELSADAAEAVIRSARLFQQALWVAESDQNLTWIMLSSAIETAADFQWRQTEDSPSEQLIAWKPQLAETLTGAGVPGLLAKVAEEFVDVTRATKKFLDFLLEFRPDAPAVRPSAEYQLAWSKTKLRDAFSKVYDYRSRALHAGTPFPAPMGWPPTKVGDAYAEKQVGSAATGSHSWSAEDLPLLLHTFEYITRHSLLSWWKSLAPPAD